MEDRVPAPPVLLLQQSELGSASALRPPLLFLPTKPNFSTRRNRLLSTVSEILHLKLKKGENPQVSLDSASPRRLGKVSFLILGIECTLDNPPSVLETIRFYSEEQS